MTVKKTYVILPDKGEIELDYLKECVHWAKQDTYERRKWFARPALIERRGGVSSQLYTGQTFDEKYFSLEADGWTHDHCEICFTTLSGFSDDVTDSEGYFNGHVWICQSCHSLFIKVEDITTSIDRLEKIVK